MEAIEFYKRKTSSEYKSRGWSYKSADSSVGRIYVNEGGSYITKTRWVHCIAAEADIFTWVAPSTTITSTIDDPYHRYNNQEINEVTEELRQWFIGISEGRKYISYTQIIKSIDTNAPEYIKGAIKAYIFLS